MGCVFCNKSRYFLKKGYDKIGKCSRRNRGVEGGFRYALMGLTENPGFLGSERV